MWLLFMRRKKKCQEKFMIENIGTFYFVHFFRKNSAFKIFTQKKKMLLTINCTGDSEEHFVNKLTS